MRKDDVKAIILIFFILLLISAIAIFGIDMYRQIIEEQTKNETKELYTSNVTILPEEDKKNNTLVVEHNDSVLNQISSSSSSDIKNKEGYYYKQLDKYSKIIYDKLKSNKENMKSGTYKIDFGKAFNELLATANGGELLQQYYQSAIESYLYDNPDVFYLAPTKMYLNIQTTKKLFSTTYEVFIDSGDNSNYLAEGYNSKQQILDVEKQIEQVAQQIISKATGKIAYKKILTVHDYLVDNLAYERTISKPNIYNIYGALVNKEAVCEGYAKAFKYLMDQLGVETVIIIGAATDSEGNTQNHAWNYVKLDNTWYAVDVTWDDPIILGGWLIKEYKYQYFLKGSDTMNEDHTERFSFIENGKVYTHPTLSKKDYK